MEALMLAQTELIDMFERTNKDWCARAKLEASVVSELATNMAAARTIPEAAGEYQEWMNKRMQMLADDGKKLIVDSQTFLSAPTGLLGKDWTDNNT
jgi:hypothetical protein